MIIIKFTLNHKSINNNAIEFLKWCNTPIFRSKGQLSFHKRATLQHADYDSYFVINDKGQSVFNEGVFPTTEELYDYYLKVNNL